MMKRSIWRRVVLSLLFAVTLGILVGMYFVTVGVSARPQPGALETFIAPNCPRQRTNTEEMS
jgi:hypothetical protein